MHVVSDKTLQPTQSRGHKAPDREMSQRVHGMGASDDWARRPNVPSVPEQVLHGLVLVLEAQHVAHPGHVARESA